MTGWIVSPTNSHVNILTLVPESVNALGNRALTEGKHDVIKVGRNPNMMNILIGRGSLDTDMLGEIEGRRRAQHWMRWLDGITDSWAWVWANSRRWWRTGKPGVLQSMGTQRVRHDWATEQKTKPKTKTQKEGHVGTQEEDSHLQAKKRSPRGNQPFSHLDLRLLASQTVRKWKKIYNKS